jgi:hypothetical protein
MEPGVGPDRFERRRAPRFRIAIPVELDEGAGITRDVSLSGVFFETDRSFAPGEQINMVMVLERVSPGRPVRLQCEGRVVRVTRFDTQIGVAVAISGYKFGLSGRLVREA